MMKEKTLEQIINIVDMAKRYGRNATYVEMNSYLLSEDVIEQLMELGYTLIFNVTKNKTRIYLQ